MSRTRTRLPPPRRLFSQADDARCQIVKGIEICSETFGRRPVGMWPSEGSVSDEALDLMADAGLSWTATDEAILFESVPGVARNGLYAPWTYRNRLAVFFRDHHLSDLIGFSYQRMDEAVAGADLAARIRQAGAGIPDAAVTVLLDGENPWDWYPEFGGRFLRAFYGCIEKEGIRTLTLGEAASSLAPGGQLYKISPGSWMGLHFDNWIGRPAANRAWEHLAAARELLHSEGPEGSAAEEAMSRILVAEGSDWFWWYSLPADPETRRRFDYLFREHVGAVYRLLGKPVPDGLLVPLYDAEEEDVSLPVLRPTVDGEETTFFEWRGAVEIDPADMWATFRPVSLPFRRVLLACDERALHLRLDPRGRPGGALTIEFGAQSGVNLYLGSRSGGDGSFCWVMGGILEVSVPLSRIPRDSRRCRVRLRYVSEDGSEIAIPPHGEMSLLLDEGEDWWV